MPPRAATIFFVYTEGARSVDNLALYKSDLALYSAPFPTPLLLFLLACFSLSVSQIHSAQKLNPRQRLHCLLLTLSLSLTHFQLQLHINIYIR